MSEGIILRFHAKKLADGGVFASYLAGAEPVAKIGHHVEIRGPSFQNPSGAGNVIGTASYDPARAPCW